MQGLQAADRPGAGGEVHAEAEGAGRGLAPRLLQVRGEYEAKNVATLQSTSSCLQDCQDRLGGADGKKCYPIDDKPLCIECHKIRI